MRTKFVLFFFAAAFAVVAAFALLWRFAAAEWLMPVLAARVEAATGLRIMADGPVKATFRPALGLQAAGIHVAEGKGPALFRADGLELELAWWPLLRGRAEPERARLLRTRVLAEPLLPPVDVDAQVRGSDVDVVLSANGGAVRATVRPEAGDLALPLLSFRGGPWSASGSGRLSLYGAVRLVLSVDRVEREGKLFGSAAVALNYGADGLILERGTWRSPQGLEAAVFGLVAPDGGALRFDGGLEAFTGPPDSGVEANARLGGTFGADGLALEIADIDIRGAGSRLTGTAKYTAGRPARIAAEFRVDRLDVAMLSDAARPLSLVAAIPPETDLDLRLRIAQFVAGATIVDGVVIDIARRGPVIELRELAARSLAGLPLQANGRLAVGPDATLTLDPLNVRYGTADAAGRLLLDLSGPLPRLSTELATGPLILDRLFAGPAPLPPEPMTRRAQAVAVAAAHQPAAPASWSAERFTLPRLPAIETELTVTTPRIAWRQYQADDAQLKVRLHDGKLEIAGLTGKAYGGRIELRGGADIGDRPRFAGTMALRDANLKSLLSDFAGIDAIVGRGDVTADLEAGGDSPVELVNSLAGVVRLAAREGAVTGFDLPAVSDRIARMNRPTDLIEVARAGGGGRTPFSMFGGQFNLERGIARTDDLRLIASKGEAHVRGAINLPRWTLDLVNELRVTEPAGVPPLVIKLDGPIQSPRQVFDINRLQGYLLRRAAPATSR
jgi:hypothetical protein